jgi:hypothetical protein
MTPLSLRRLSSCSSTVVCATLALACSGTQEDPKTAANQQGGPAPEETAELPEVRDFRQSIADRQALMQRTAAPSVGQALVSVADRFYQDNQQMLQQAFQASLSELEEGNQPDTGSARLVGSVDAATPAEAAERRQLAQFHLVFTPDVREQAMNAFNAAFVPLASAQAEMPVTRAGELYGFFSVAEPRYTRCGENQVCIHYGESDVFVVSFAALEEALWTPEAVAWWTTVPPQATPGTPEGIGRGPDGTPSDAPTPPEHATAQPTAAQPTSAAGTETAATSPGAPLPKKDQSPKK